MIATYRGGGAGSRCSGKWEDEGLAHDRTGEKKEDSHGILSLKPVKFVTTRRHKGLYQHGSNEVEVGRNAIISGFAQCLKRNTRLGHWDSYPQAPPQSNLCYCVSRWETKAALWWLLPASDSRCSRDAQEHDVHH